MGLEPIKKEILDILKSNITDSIWYDSYISINTLSEGISANKSVVEKAIKNLLAHGYVEIKVNIFTDEWSKIAITQKGIDALENMAYSTYETASNVAHNTGNQNINIYGDVQGDVLASVKGDLTKNTYVFEAFDNARIQVQKDSTINTHKKNEIIQHVDAIEEESKKIEPNKDRINSSWLWIKRNAPRIVESILTKVVGGLLLRAI